MKGLDGRIDGWMREFNVSSAQVSIQDNESHLKKDKLDLQRGPFHPVKL